MCKFRLLMPRTQQQHIHFLLVVNGQIKISSCRVLSSLGRLLYVDDTMTRMMMISIMMTYDGTPVTDDCDCDCYGNDNENDCFAVKSHLNAYFGVTLSFFLGILVEQFGCRCNDWWLCACDCCGWCYGSNCCWHVKWHVAMCDLQSFSVFLLFRHLNIFL